MYAGEEPTASPSRIQLWLVATGDTRKVSLAPASITTFPVDGVAFTMILNERMAAPSALVTLTS